MSLFEHQSNEFIRGISDQMNRNQANAADHRGDHPG